MKRIGIVWILMLVFLIPQHAIAQENVANWDSVYDTWDVIISAEGGLSFRFSWAASPSVELIFLTLKIEDFMPLDFGVRFRPQ